MKIQYLFRVISGSKLKTLWSVVDQVHERSGKNKVGIFLDVVSCALFHGAGYHDYLIFGYETIPRKKRRTYLTRIRNKKLIDMVNDPSLYPIFDEKSKFDKRFASYLKREFLTVEDMTQEALEKFAADKEYLFVKPNEGESGKGIERLKVADFQDIAELYRYIKDPAKRFGVVEQELKQHPDMLRLYPNSVNSLRMATIIGDDGKPHCLYITCKMGNNGKFVDNMENDGLACPVDPKTGKICGVAHTSALINYDKHPYTGVELVGYQLPYIPEAIRMVKQAAMEEPRMRYLGWDVAITPDGPAIIEGNNYPGYDFSQLPEHTPDRIGTLAVIRRYVKGI